MAEGLTDRMVMASALDVTGFGDTARAANRAVSNTVDYSISTGVLMVGWVVFITIILLLLRDRATRDKAASTRDSAREKAAEERYKMDAARMERDIASRQELAKALQELSVLMRSFKCIAHTNPTAPMPKLLPAPEES